jgi:hypothetical protein
MIRKHIAPALLAAAVLAAPQAAQAQGLLDIGRALLGIPGEEKPAIDYRERAPLVVPPRQELRPPAEAVPADQRRANWPQDPDVIARRQAAENARRPANFDAITSRDPADTRRMTLNEIRAGRVAGQEVNRVPSTPGTFGPNAGQGFANVMGGVSALREMDKQSAAAARTDGQLDRSEPKREFLTDPPSGIRRPADNAAFRATREGQVGRQELPSPYDIYRESPNTR